MEGNLGRGLKAAGGNRITRTRCKDAVCVLDGSIYTLVS